MTLVIFSPNGQLGPAMSPALYPLHAPSGFNSCYTRQVCRQVLEVGHTSSVLLLPFPAPKRVSQKKGGKSLCTPKMEHILYYGYFEASKTYFLPSWQHILSYETASQFRYSKLSFWDAMSLPIPQNYFLVIPVYQRQRVLLLITEL